MPQVWKKFALLVGFLTFSRVPRLREQQHSTLEGSFALLATLKSINFQYMLQNVGSVITTRYWSTVIPYIEPADDSLFSHIDIKNAFDFSGGKEIRIIVHRKRAILEHIAFVSYREVNKQDVCKGIHLDNYLQIVEQITSFLNMPDDFTRLIREAVYFRDGRKLALHTVRINGLEGSFYFGRIIIIKKKNRLVDFAYSLHRVTFALAPEDLQVNKDSLAEFVRFAESSPNSGILTFKGRNLMDQFFRNTAVDKFQQNYDTLVKTNEVAELV